MALVVGVPMPMLSALYAYRAFDRYERGRLKTELLPAVAARSAA
jgi:hypothetical protein